MAPDARQAYFLALRGVQSDHYESETLRKVLRHRAATDRVRDAVVMAAEDLSRHYREEVRKAAGRASSAAQK